MQRRDWDIAIDQLVELRTKTAHLPGVQTQTNMLMAICFQNKGDRNAEQESLKLVLSKAPTHGAARVALARSYINEGRIREGIEEYQQAVRSPYASATTHASLLRLKMRQYQLTDARQSDWQQLRRIVDELTSSYPPTSSMPVQLHAELDTAQGEPLKALERLREATSQQPGDVLLWTVFAEQLADQMGITAGLQVLDEGQAACGDRPDLRLCRARLHARDPMRLYPIEPLLKQTDTWTDAQRDRLQYGMIDVVHPNDAELRLKIYQEIAHRRPADREIWVRLGEAAIAANDSPTLAKARQTLTKLDPSGKSLALVDAEAALKQGDGDALAVATERMNKLFGERPTQDDACVLLARLNAAQQKHPEARRLFERALALEPSHFEPIQDYMTYLVDNDDQTELARQLNRMTLDPVWAGNPLQQVISTAASQASATGANSLLDACAKLPGHSAWLGGLYARIGANEAALREYAKAIQANPANADHWLRLALVQDPDSARETLRLAKTKLQPPLYFAMASRYLESPLGIKGWTPELVDAEERKQFVQTRLALKLAIFDRPGATKLLEDYLASDGLSVPQQAWGQRNLAMLLAIRGTPADRERALTLLAQHPESSGENAGEKRATAAILSSLSRYLDGEDRKRVEDRAISVMREIVEQNPSPRDAFLLAQLYRAAGQHTQGKAILNQLLAKDPKNLDYHLMALEILTQDGSYKEAEAFAERILALYPTTYSAVSTVAEYEAKSGDVARAMALAEGYLRTATGSAGNLPAKTAQVAALLDQLAHLPGVRRTPEGRKVVEAAIRHYVGLVARRPEVVITAAGLLGSDDQYQRAFDFIEEHGAKLPAALKTAAGLAILRNGDATPRQFDQVAGWLKQTKQELPDSLSLRLNEAEFHSLKHEYAEAERIYQSVLDNDPGNVVALNNLAWILAPNPDATQRAMKLIERAVSEVGLDRRVARHAGAGPHRRPAIQPCRGRSARSIDAEPHAAADVPSRLGQAGTNPSQDAGSPSSVPLGPRTGVGHQQHPRRRFAALPRAGESTLSFFLTGMERVPYNRSMSDPSPISGREDEVRDSMLVGSSWPSVQPYALRTRYPSRCEKQSSEWKRSSRGGLNTQVPAGTGSLKRVERLSTITFDESSLKLHIIKNFHSRSTVSSILDIWYGTMMECSPIIPSFRKALGVHHKIASMTEKIDENLPQLVTIMNTICRNMPEHSGPSQRLQVREGECGQSSVRSQGQSRRARCDGLCVGHCHKLQAWLTHLAGFLNEVTQGWWKTACSHRAGVGLYDSRDRTNRPSQDTSARSCSRVIIKEYDGYMFPQEILVRHIEQDRPGIMVINIAYTKC